MIDRAEVPEGATGNPVIAVSSEKAIEVQAWEDKPTGIGEPLVQIDSTLMGAIPASASEAEGSASVVVLDDASASSRCSPSVAAAPASVCTAIACLRHGAAAAARADVAADATPAAAAARVRAHATARHIGHSTGSPRCIPPGMEYPRMVSDAGTGFFRESGQIPQYGTDQLVAVHQKSRKRLVFIAVGSALAIAATAVAIVVLTGGNKPAAGAGSGLTAIAKMPTSPGSADVSGSAAAPPVGSAGSATPQVVDPTPGSGAAPRRSSGLARARLGRHPLRRAMAPARSR